MGWARRAVFVSLSLCVAGFVTFAATRGRVSNAGMTVFLLSLFATIALFVVALATEGRAGRSVRAEQMARLGLRPSGTGLVGERGGFLLRVDVATTGTPTGQMVGTIWGAGVPPDLDIRATGPFLDPTRAAPVPTGDAGLDAAVALRGPAERVRAFAQARGGPAAARVVRAGGEVADGRLRLTRPGRITSAPAASALAEALRDVGAVFLEIRAGITPSVAGGAPAAVALRPGQRLVVGGAPDPAAEAAEPGTVVLTLPGGGSAPYSAVLRLHEGRLELADVNSYGGVRVNGSVVAKAVLQVGDEVQIADTTLVVRSRRPDTPG